MLRTRGDTRRPNGPRSHSSSQVLCKLARWRLRRSLWARGALALSIYRSAEGRIAQRTPLDPRCIVSVDSPWLWLSTAICANLECLNEWFPYPF